MAQKLNAAMWKQLLQRSSRESMSLQGRIREIYNLAFMKTAWVIEDIGLLLKESN